MQELVKMEKWKLPGSKLKSEGMKGIFPSAVVASLKAIPDYPNSLSKLSRSQIHRSKVDQKLMQAC